MAEKRKESIFFATIRALFISIAAVVGVAAGVLVVVLVTSKLNQSSTVPEESNLTVDVDHNWNRSLLPDSSPVLLKINVSGVIGQFKLKSEKIFELLIDSRRDGLDKRIKGIILYIDSPGGAANDSSAIYRLLEEYKQRYNVPVYAYVDGMCASGAMYIACAANKIFSSPDSIIGSVGVRFGPNFNVVEAMNKLGVKSLTLTQGKGKDDLNPFRPWKEGEAAVLNQVMHTLYDQFTQTVSDARNIPLETLVQDYGARIYAAPLAKSYGYIDEVVPNYSEFLASFAKELGIKDEENYQVLLIESRQSLIRDISQGESNLLNGRVEHVFSIGPYLSSDMAGKILFLYDPVS